MFIRFNERTPRSRKNKSTTNNRNLSSIIIQIKALKYNIYYAKCSLPTAFPLIYYLIIHEKH